MFKITYSDNTVEELPAEFIKINGFNVEHFQKSIKQIFVPKEVKNFSGCFANGNIKIDLEEGLKKIFITAYRGTTIKIPLSCQKLTFFNVCLETLFVPKNVMVFDFTPEPNDVHKFSSMIKYVLENTNWPNYNIENLNFKSGKFIEDCLKHDEWMIKRGFAERSCDIFNSYIKKIWLDSKEIIFNPSYGADNYSKETSYNHTTYYQYLKIRCDWIRFNPEDKLNINNFRHCAYNQPLNRNKLLTNYSNPTICLGQEIKGSIDPRKTTYLTKEQYLEIYGEGKCSFMPVYSDVEQPKQQSQQTEQPKQQTEQPQTKQQIQEIIKLYVELQKQGIKLTKPKIKDYTQEQLKQTFEHYQQLKTIFEETEKLITEQNEQADILTSFEEF